MYTDSLSCSGSYFYVRNKHDIRSHFFEFDEINSFPNPALTSSIAAFLPALKHSHIARVWANGIGQKIVDVLTNNKVLFDAVDCLRRPRALSSVRKVFPCLDASHVVIITVRELPSTSFHDLHQKTFVADQVIDQIFRLAEGFLVELRSDTVGLFAKTPSLGSSLGFRDDSTSNATLGGFVNLIDDEQNTVAECAITCDHVARPYSRGDGIHQRTNSTDSYFRGNTPNELPLYCFSPSFASYQDNISSKRKELVRRGAEILAYKHGNNEEVFPRADLRRLRYTRTKLQNDTAKAIAMDRILGTVYATSGYGFSRHRHRLDWALIQVQNDRLPGDRRNKVDPVGDSQMRSRQILHATKPRKDTKVYKNGFGTGTTIGVVNTVQSYVVTYDADGRSNVTPEWCIIPAVGEGEVFAGKGDSGSLVLEMDTTNVMGMLWGGHMNGGPAYFTSITAIATDIERVTGLKTQLPGGSIIPSRYPIDGIHV